MSGPRGGARCVRCNRPLTDPVSISMGMGPECRGRTRFAGSTHAPARSAGVKSILCKRDEFSDEFDNTIPFEQALVLKRRFVDGPSDMDKVGGVITNVPHLVVHHSPDGYEFGYAGSGPADLALNICQLYLNMTGYKGEQIKCYDGKCWGLAWKLHQKFKQDIVALVPRSGASIPFSMLDVWFTSTITSDLLDQYSLINKE
jgi:hypothetical protein